jgi:hypothetical protein
MDRGKRVFRACNSFIFLQRSKMKNVKFVLCILFVLGCSPAQRLAKLQKKHPELFKESQDTTIINEIYYDTTFDFIFDVDTITTFDTITNTKIVQILKRDTIFKTIKQRNPQRIYITKTKTITIPQEQNFGTWLYFALALFIFVIIWKILK